MAKQIPFNKSAIQASECLSGAWDVLKDQYWLFLGMILLGGLIGGCVPIARHFFFGPITVGLYYTAFVLMRREQISFDMLFKGFQKFVPAMVVGLIQSAPELLSDILNLFSNFIQLAMIGLDPKRNRFVEQNSFAPSDMAAPLIIGIILIFLVIFIAALAFGFAWRITFVFALPLMAEHDLTVGEALSLGARAGWSNVGGLIVLMILQALVLLAGALALCIGVIFVSPIIQVSNAVAYRMVFPETPQSNVYNEPPRPDYYGGSYGAA
jgi:hypothetical protein